MADDPQDHAGTDGVLGNLPATRPGRRSTRRAAVPADPVDAEEPNPPRARADTAGEAPEASARTTGTKRAETTGTGAKATAATATGTKAPRTKQTAAKAAGAKGAGTKATGAKAAGTKATGTGKSRPAAGTGTGAAKAGAARPTGSKTAAKPAAGKAGAKASGSAGSSAKSTAARPEANRSVRRGPAPDAPPVAPAPRSGWATPRADDGAADGGGGLTGLVGGAVQGGERLVRGVLGRIVRR